MGGGVVWGEYTMFKGKTRKMIVSKLLAFSNNQ